MCSWASLPPELLRKIVTHVRAAAYPAAAATAAVQQLRRACAPWRAALDADARRVAPTAPLERPWALFQHFPNCEELDLSRYQGAAVALYGYFHLVELKALILGDLRACSWDGTPQINLPLASLSALTRLVVPADFLLVPSVLASLADAAAKLPALRALELPRAVLTPHRADDLARALARCPGLRSLSLGGAGAPVLPADLASLLAGCGTRLEALALDRLGARALPPAVSTLTALTALRFRGEASRGVQMAAADLAPLAASLKVLDLAANLSEQLPRGVAALTALEELRAREWSRLFERGQGGGV